MSIFNNIPFMDFMYLYPMSTKQWNDEYILYVIICKSYGDVVYPLEYTYKSEWVKHASIYRRDFRKTLPDIFREITN